MWHSVSNNMLCDSKLKISKILFSVWQIFNKVNTEWGWHATVFKICAKFTLMLNKYFYTIGFSSAFNLSKHFRLIFHVLISQISTKKRFSFAQYTYFNKCTTVITIVLYRRIYKLTSGIMFQNVCIYFLLWSN